MLKKTKRTFQLLLCLFFCLVISSSTVLAVSYKDLQAPFYDANSVDEECIGGPAGTGPLYGPRFPQISDTADLANRIQNYIKNTVPNSPLASHAQDFVTYGQKYNVNPAFVVSLAQKETSLGIAGNGPAPQNNIFNVRNGSGGSFGGYPSIEASIEAVNKLLSGDLYLGPPSNFTTIKQIMYRYAPPSENDTANYVQFNISVMKKNLDGIQTGGGADSTVATNDCGQGDTSSGSVNTDGYAFPVAPQKKSANGSVSGMSALPCSSSSCHHDGTAAFDISRQPGGDAIVGTAVYAISDGEVDMVHTYSYLGQPIYGCYSLQLHSTKDGFWYWYGHIQSPTVKSGDKVKAGQKVAVVGARKCTGNGSDSHLHIDRGCVKDGVKQKGGYESCRDAGINELMNQLYKELPE